MLKILRSKKAQAAISEYAILIALIVAGLTSMTVFMNRALQARIRNSAKGMVAFVRNQAGNSYNGALYYQYEPYYLNTVANVSRDLVKTDKLMQDGISDQGYNSTVSSNMVSSTAPAKDYKLTGAY